MKHVQYLNKHFAIWSFLCGDHALKNEVKLLDETLISKPDFLNPLENNLRLEVFKSKRNWIAKTMDDNVSLALYKFTLKDLKKLDTCFTHVKLKDYVDEYIRAFDTKTDFSINRKEHFKKDLIKPNYDVVKEHEIMINMEKCNHKLKIKDVLDYTQRNEQNLFLALNRCFIMKNRHTNEYTIMDGNHRISAYYWSKIKNPHILPNYFYSFLWEEIY